VCNVTRISLESGLIWTTHKNKPAILSAVSQSNCGQKPPPAARILCCQQSKSRDDQRAVSEIIGVVMLLAMVIVVMGGVMTIIQPYLNDFDDNKDWSQSKVIAEQVEEKIKIVGSSPQGVGSVSSISLGTSMISSIDSAELWTIQADLQGYDKINIEFTGTQLIRINSMNNTAHTMNVTTSGTTTEWQIPDGEGPHEFESGTPFGKTVIIQVYDSEGHTIHQLIRASLSGLRIESGLQSGDYIVDLINGAKLEKLPYHGYSINKYPNLRVDTLHDGIPRISLVLVDVSGGENIETGRDIKLNLESAGVLSFFGENTRNLKIGFDCGIDDVIAPQYTHHWAGDYELYQSAGISGQYVGLGPWERLSNSEITYHPTDTTLFFDLTIQRVVILE